jgi:hypothetical protein
MGRTEARPDARLREVAGTNISATAERIVAAFGQARQSDITAGARWYPDALAFIDEQAELHGKTREQVTAVVAHLSPRTQWERTMEGTMSLLATGRTTGHLKANVARATRALASDDPLGTLVGRKTNRFAQNLLGDRDAVTVDVWAGRVALGRRADLALVLARVGAYEAIEHSYRVAARRLGVDPATAQATTWVIARRAQRTRVAA